MKPKVFISYSRSDAPFVTKLRAQLRQAELSTWLDVDALKPGTEWQPRLEQALRSASAMVACISPDSVKSHFVTFEWSYALGAGVRVFPVLVKETPMHPWVARIQWIDLSGANPPWQDLVKALKTVPRSRLERRSKEQVRKTASEAKILPPKQRQGPKLSAQFEMRDEKPVKIGDEYSIALKVKNAPVGTPGVAYELHDESFDEPRFSVNNSAEEFEVWISSYGDVRVSARGDKGSSTWETSEMLGDALKRGHGRRPSEAIRKAIASIKRY